MMDNEKYEYMKVKPAENGWVLCFDEKVKNDMMPESTYGNNMMRKEKKMVFEQSSTVSNEKALDNALAYLRTMLLENKKGA